MAEYKDKIEESEDIVSGSEQDTSWKHEYGVSIKQIAKEIKFKETSIGKLISKYINKFEEANLKVIYVKNRGNKINLKELILFEEQVTLLFKLMKSVGDITYDMLIESINDELGYELVGKRNESIYIIKNENFYKIGLASNVKRRLYGIQTGNHQILTIFFEKKVEDAKELENILHSYFRNNHINGEWFELNSNDLIEAINIINRLSKYISIKNK